LEILLIDVIFPGNIGPVDSGYKKRYLSPGEVAEEGTLQIACWIEVIVCSS